MRTASHDARAITIMSTTGTTIIMPALGITFLRVSDANAAALDAQIEPALRAFAEPAIDVPCGGSFEAGATSVSTGRGHDGADFTLNVKRARQLRGVLRAPAAGVRSCASKAWSRRPSGSSPRITITTKRSPPSASPIRARSIRRSSTSGSSYLLQSQGQDIFRMKGVLNMQGRGSPLRLPRRAHDVRLAPRAAVGQHAAPQQPGVHRAQARSQGNRSRLRVLHRMSGAVLSERTSVALDTYIVDVAWSPDGTALAVAGGEGAVVLVENMRGQAASARARRAWHGRHRGRVAARLASRGLVRAGQRGRAVGYRRCQLRRSACGRARRGPSTSRIRRTASCSRRQQARCSALWDGAGELVHASSRSRRPSPRSRGTSPGAISPRPRKARCASIASSRRSSAMRRYTWPAACLTAAYSPNGRVLASGTQDGTVHFWMLATGKDSQMRGYGTKVTLTEWSANSRYLATTVGQRSHRVGFRRQGSGRLRAAAARRAHGARHAPRVSSHGPVARLRGTRLARDAVAAGQGNQGGGCAPERGEITAMRWSPDGQRLAVGESKGRLTIYELLSRAAPVKSKMH